ncbi:hypothetical protein McanCB56680_006038 [Microsporum canis]
MRAATPILVTTATATLAGGDIKITAILPAGWLAITTDPWKCLTHTLTDFGSSNGPSMTTGPTANPGAGVSATNAISPTVTPTPNSIDGRGQSSAEAWVGSINSTSQ